MACLNLNNGEIQTLMKRSGLTPFESKFYITHFVKENGRLPRLDEIPGVDSIESLVEHIGLNQKSGLMDTEKLLENTSSTSVEEAKVKLNNTFTDKETDITNLGFMSEVKIVDRPTKGKVKGALPEITEKSIPDNAYFVDTLFRLQDLYGINLKQITNRELGTAEWLEKVPDGQSSTAFIYKGEIYINVDNAKSSSPVHEMMHILLGSMKYTNPDIYNSLVSLSEQLPNYERLVLNYPKRMRSDVNEELLITEFSRYITGEDSIMNQLPNEIISEIKYNIFRTLDTIVFGKHSVEKINPTTLMNSSLKELSNVLKSDKFNVAQSYVSRTLNNKKSRLLKEGHLKEICI